MFTFKKKVHREVGAARLKCPVGVSFPAVGQYQGDTPPVPATHPNMEASCFKPEAQDCADRETNL